MRSKYGLDYWIYNRGTVEIMEFLSLKGVFWEGGEGGGIVSSKSHLPLDSTPVELYPFRNNNLNIMWKTDPSVSVSHPLSDNPSPASL